MASHSLHLDLRPVCGDRSRMDWLDCTPRPNASLQLAANGRWENAIVPGDLTPERLSAWIAAAGPDIAIETVFHDDQAALIGFFGFRRTIDASDIRLRFWTELLTRATGSVTDRPAAQFQRWLDMLEVPALLSVPPDGCQLGVFNQWTTAGALDLDGERVAMDALPDAPAWLRDGAEAPICREISWKVPEKVWIAENASEASGGLHRLRPAFVAG